MATIVRCPNCISLVYDGADVCHHCGEELSRKKRKFFSKGAVLFIIIAVTAFAIGDAIYLAKERGKIMRYDRRAIADFLEKVQDDRPGASVTWRANREREVAAELRTFIKSKLGCNDGLHRYQIKIHELRWLGSDDQFIRWGPNHHREVEVRRLEVPVSFRDKDADDDLPPHRLFLTIGAAGPWYGVKIVTASWEGREPGVIPAKRVSGG